MCLVAEFDCFDLLFANFPSVNQGRPKKIGWKDGIQTGYSPGCWQVISSDANIGL